jgi:hypothetical protein
VSGDELGREMPCGQSVDRNIHFSEAARRRGVDCGHDERHVRLKGSI